VIRDGLSDYDRQTQRYLFAQSILAYWDGQVYTPEETVARSHQYRDNYSHLVVMCGGSGTGKSTWIRNNCPGYNVISLDRLRKEITGDVRDHSAEGQVRQLSKERLKESLREGENVVWDATNIRRDFRKIPLSLGGSYDAFTSLVTMWVPEEEARKSNRDREESVPESVIGNQYDRFQFPFPDEAHEVVFLDENHNKKKRFLGGIDTNHLRF
jgi:predicted kinase